MPVRGAARVAFRRRALEHDPEKWIPVFGKDHALRRMINQTANQIATPITRTASGGANIRASFSSTYDLRIAISTAPLFMHSSTSRRVKRSAKRSLPNAVSHCSIVVGTKTPIPLQLERQEV